MNLVKVGIIGVGNMGQAHAEAFNAIPDTKVVGVCGRTEEKVKAFAKTHHVPFACTSISDLYEKVKPDICVIAVPELQANQVCKKAFTYPWVILMEKPCGYDLADANQIYTYSQNAKAQVLVGLNRRFYSSVSAIKLNLNKRDDPRFIHVQDQQNFDEARLHGHPEEVVHKFMYANSIHNIDLILTFARGEVKKINQISPWKGEKTDIMLTHLEFDSGDSALYEGVWQGPAPWACSVLTKSSRWVMQPLETATVQYAGERIRHSIDIDPIDKEFKAGIYRQAEAVIKYHKKQDNHAVLLSESMRTMKLINQMFGV